MRGFVVGFLGCLLIGVGPLCLTARAYEIPDTPGLALGDNSSVLVGGGNLLGNPALLARGSQWGDTLLSAPSYRAQSASQARFARPLDDFLAARDALTSNPDPLTAQAALAGAQALFGRDETRFTSVGVAAAFPNLPVALGGYFRGSHQQTRRVDAFGPATITNPAQVDYNANYTVKSVTVFEAGTVLAKNFRDDGQGADYWSVGVRPKLLVLRTDYRSVPLSDPALVAAPGLVNNSGWINFDVGVVGSYGYRWHWGLQADDVVPRQADYFSLGDDAVRSEPHLSTAVSFEHLGWTWVGGADLTATSAWTGETRSQTLSLGVEKATEFGVALRLGTSYDLRDRGIWRWGGGVQTHWGPATVDVGHARSDRTTVTALDLFVGF